MERLAGLGAYVEEADPDFTDPVEAFHTLWFSGAARVTQRLGARAAGAARPGAPRDRRDRGARYSALDYLAAVDVRMELGRRMGRFHESYDLLVTPTLPITAFEAGAEVPKGSGHRRWTGWTPFTYPFNLTQQPAATVPVRGGRGRAADRACRSWPPATADALVLRAAHALYEAGAARTCPRAEPTRGRQARAPDRCASDPPEAERLPQRARAPQVVAGLGHRVEALDHLAPDDARAPSPTSPLISRLLRS